MATEDIRVWGRTNGFDVSDEGRLPAGLRAAYDAREIVEEVTERPPAIVKTSTLDRVRTLSEKVKKSAPPVKRGRPVAKPRVSTEKVISQIWSVLAGAVTRYSNPVGLTLSLQAPVVGLILEDKIKNTIADRVLQPIARTADGGNVAFALIGPPLIVGLIERYPQRVNEMVPVLRASLRSWISVAGDKFDELQEEEKLMEEKYGEKTDEMMAMILTAIGFGAAEPSV